MINLSTDIELLRLEIMSKNDSELINAISYYESMNLPVEKAVCMEEMRIRNEQRCKPSDNLWWIREK